MIRPVHEVDHADFRCPSCGVEIRTLASNRPCHRCPGPDGHPHGPEVEFRRIDESAA